MKCTACKALFAEPTTKAAHAGLLPDSVGILKPLGDRNYRCKRLLDAMAATIGEKGNA
jgi:hypothetical protein